MYQATAGPKIKKVVHNFKMLIWG